MVSELVHSFASTNAEVNLLALKLAFCIYKVMW